MPDLSHVQLMGILNVTPDSFSDGGQINTPALALERAKKMRQEGADILDIGGESSGPGSQDVSPEEEKQRVIPALKEILTLETTISVDTYKSEIADEALTLGANIINDITGLRGDQKMAETIAKHNAKVVIMYSKDQTARTTNEEVQYDDVIATIKKFFDQQIQYAVSQGIKKKNIILDPGMGAFISGDPSYSFEILDRLKELKTYELPILIGTSKKSMHRFSVKDRLIPSVATALQAAFNGANILRVHDVKEHRLALDTFSA